MAAYTLTSTFERLIYTHPWIFNGGGDMLTFFLNSETQATSLRKRRSLHAVTPISATGSSAATVSRERSKSRTAGERGPNAPVRNTMLTDVIFSPQSDGIIVILRPALQSGIRPT